MIKKRTAWIIGITAFLIPVIVFLLFMQLVLKQVTMMGTDQRIAKTNNYTALSKIAPQDATVFFGDSITELCPLEDLYAGYTEETGIPVINRGISAETTATMLERFEANVIGLQPRNLVLLMGVNDISAGIPQNSTVTHIQQIIQTAKAKSPKTHIVLQAVYPINKSDRKQLYETLQIGDRDHMDIRELNQMLKQLAEDEKITFLNVNALLENEQGELKKEYTYDGIHPNTAGYLAVRDKIIEVLK